MNGLQRRYTILIAGIVAAAILTHGALQSFANYRAAVRQVQQQQDYEARLAALKLTQYVERLSRTAQWLADFGLAADAVDWQRLRTEAHIALRAEPAVDAAILRRRGECLRVSRFLADQRLPCASPTADDRAAASDGPVRWVGNGKAPPVIAITARPQAPAELTIELIVQLAFAWDIVDAAAPPGDGIAALIDADGRLLAHPDIAEAMAPRALPAQIVDGAFVAPVIGRSGGGGSVVRSSYRVDPMGWTVLVESPSGVLLKPVLQELQRSMMVLLLWGLIAIIGAAWLARRLAAPVQRLEQTVRAFGAGDRTRRSDVARDDELGSLATSFNRMADELQAYTGQLESRVAEKTRELAQANDHKSQFLANVSHELRTPLNAIVGYSDALTDGILGPLTPKQRESVEYIHRSGLTLEALIKDLLDLSKVEAGQIDFVIAPLAVQDLVDSSINVLRDRAERGGVTLRTEVGNNVDTWIGDELRLRQCVMNLLSNAVKFTRPGGTVTLSVRQTAEQLEIAVADTGVGIPEDQLPRLFERFSRIQHVVPAGFVTPKGTGLGLALTKSFVELHGGRITVTSQVGEGSTFTLVLPALKQTKDDDGNGLGG